MSQYLAWYVPGEKKVFEDHPELFDGFMISAHVLEHRLEAIAVFLKKIHKKFYIDPETYVFQLDPTTTILKEEDLSLRLSWDKLIQQYGPMGSLLKNWKLNLSALLAQDGTPKQRVLSELASSMIDFQMDRIESKVETGLARFLEGYSTIEPDALLSPYFYAESRDDPWYAASLGIALESAKYKRKRNLYAVIFISQLFLNERGIAEVVRDYANEAFDGYCLWVKDLDEMSAGAGLLRHFSQLVKGLSATGKPVINLYGGYYSALLHHVGMKSIASGLTYKELSGGYTRMAGGPAGGVKPKYYLNKVHKLVPVDLAERIVQQFPEFQCDCDACRQIGSNLALLVGSLGLRISKEHYLLSRKRELQQIEDQTLQDLLKEIEAVYRAYSAHSPLIETEHLSRWIEALGPVASVDA